MDTNTNKTAGAPFCKKRWDENSQESTVFVSQTQNYAHWNLELAPMVTIESFNEAVKYIIYDKEEIVIPHRGSYTLDWF